MTIRAVCLAAACALAGVCPAAAATFVVADGDVGSLIAAIADANDEGTYPGSDSIDLANDGTYTLTGINNFTEGANGLPSITSDVTILGGGSTIQRSTASGVPPFRLFHVAGGGTLRLTEVTLRNGRAVGALPSNQGGAIYATGSVILERVTLRANSAASQGGGVFSHSGVTVINSTLSGNSAAGGGALFFDSGGSGTLLNTTITLNTATRDGGGLLVAGGEPVFYTNTILAGNTAAFTPDCLGFAISNGNNLLASGTGCAPTAGDHTTSNIANELDTTLAENGGPTETHALISGSQAIDAGNDAVAPVVDQRNQPRPVDGTADGTATSDIGAYEYVPPPAVLVVESGGATDVTEGGSTDSYTVQLQTRPLNDVVVNVSPDAQLLSSLASLTFTAADWLVPQTITVTAVDDFVVEGPHTGTITHTASSAGADYDAIAIPSVTANITDNDNAADIEGAYFTVTPCRALDTRTPQDAPALASGVVRVVPMHGMCGIPTSAKALALNVTVTQPTGAGFLSVFPADIAPESALPTVHFPASQTRANNAVLPLSSDGSGALGLLPQVAGSGTVHVIIDVMGFFQ